MRKNGMFCLEDGHKQVIIEVGLDSVFYLGRRRKGLKWPGPH